MGRPKPKKPLVGPRTTILYTAPNGARQQVTVGCSVEQAVANFQEIRRQGGIAQHRIGATVVEVNLASMAFIAYAPAVDVVTAPPPKE